VKNRNKKLTNNQKSYQQKMIFLKKSPIPHPSTPPFKSKRPQKITNMKTKKSEEI